MHGRLGHERVKPLAVGGAYKRFSCALGQDGHLRVPPAIPVALANDAVVPQEPYLRLPTASSRYIRVTRRLPSDGNRIAGAA